MEIINKLWEKIKPHYIWYALLLVVLLYAGSFASNYFGYTYPAGLLSQAAATIIAGGVFASLLKSYQYSELFKGELENLFADEKFVGKMKHIAQHGKDDKQTMRNTFEHLAAKSGPQLGNRVAVSFPRMLQIDTAYSFRNYKRYIKITGYAKTKGIITIEDEVQYEVVVQEATTYRSSAGGVAIASSPKIKEFSLTDVSTGDVVDLSQASPVANGAMSVSTPVARGRIYRLHRNLELSYQLFKDPIIHQQFSRFSEGFELEIDNQIPNDVQFTMTWINYDKDPVPNPRNDGSRTVCRFTEHGLTFPYQGFILTMCPNK